MNILSEKWFSLNSWGFFFLLFLTGNILHMNQRKLMSKPDNMGHYVTCSVTAFMSPNKVAAGLTLFPSSSAQISICILKTKTIISSRKLRRRFSFSSSKEDGLIYIEV